jgi:sugar-specific transcriptional regulator TrmB
MSVVENLSKVMGLSKYESAIYVALTDNGPSHISKISKYIDAPRTAIYPPLSNLIKKGLISESVFGKRKYYSAIPKENLKLIFEEKRNSLENILLELGQSTHLKSRDAKLDVTLHPGSHGIKSAGLIFMNETTDKIWYSFENLARITDNVGFEFENFYIKERVKRKIHSKVILSLNDESPTIRSILKENKQHLRETIIISPTDYPFETTVAVTKDLILLINPNQNPFALLIRNKSLANTFIKIHKFIWDRFSND